MDSGYHLALLILGAGLFLLSSSWLGAIELGLLSEDQWLFSFIVNMTGSGLFVDSIIVLYIRAKKCETELKKAHANI